MKLILVMVTSLDGRSTKGHADGTHAWNSEEDRKHFNGILESASLLIMGSSTYEGARNSMQHTEGKLRIVITRDPSKYESEKITGKLEFTNETPTNLVRRLESQGITNGYLLGGAHTNTEFFKEKLVTELWQTLEPKILGMGNGIIGEEETDVTLQLLSLERLNEKGTLLLKYTVV